MKRSKSKKTLEKWGKISEIILKNPYISIKEINKITGIPVPTISRLCKDNNSDKKDMRYRKNVEEMLRRDILHEVSDN